jgi:hypothetical protein
MVRRCSLWLFLAPAAAAQEMRGANTVAIGGAAVAQSEDNSAIAANPAALGSTSRYDLSASFDVTPGTAIGWNLSAMDSSKGAVGFGAAWQRTSSDPAFEDDELPGWKEPGTTPSNHRVADVLTAAIAFAPDEREWSIGLSGTWSQERHVRLGGAATADLSVGGAWHPSEAATVGLVVRDVLPVGNALTRPAAVEAGARYALPEGAAAAIDVGWQLEEANRLGLLLRGGFEGGAGPARFRIGGRYDGPSRTGGLTLGGGATNDAGAIDYAMDIPVGTPFALEAIRHVFTVRIRT